MEIILLDSVFIASRHRYYALIVLIIILPCGVDATISFCEKMLRMIVF